MSDTADFNQIRTLLGDKAKDLLEHQCKTVPKEQLHLPSPNFVSDVWAGSDRNVPTLRSLEPAQTSLTKFDAIGCSKIGALAS